jgi:hypothetical protein
MDAMKPFVATDAWTEQYPMFRRLSLSPSSKVDLMSDMIAYCIYYTHKVCSWLTLQFADGVQNVEYSIFMQLIIQNNFTAYRHCENFKSSSLYLFP